MTELFAVVLSGVLMNFISSASAGCRTSNNVNVKSKETETTSLHHIFEFRKRDQVFEKDCVNGSNPSAKSTERFSALGRYGLLHVRSQHVKQQTGTRRANNPFVPEGVIITKLDEESGFRKTEDARKQLHKLKLRAETISMLHKIVEKYFPGGHLTVDQKIKALKILGKLIKLKKEGQISDIRAILESPPKKNRNDLNKKASENAAAKNVTREKVEGNGEKILENKTDEDGGGGNGGDIYATIANGPDMPKLPPAVNEKDPEHTYSNTMPVGIPPMNGDGKGYTTLMGRPNDIGDSTSGKIESPWSQYLDEPLAGGNLGLEQIYNSRNNYYGDKIGLAGMPMMNAAEARSHMPFLPRYHHGESYENLDQRGYDDDDEDDDDADVDDGDEDEEDELERARSYVKKHDDDDDDWDDSDVFKYSHRFDRKDKIARIKKKGKITHYSKRKDVNRVTHYQNKVIG